MQAQQVAAGRNTKHILYSLHYLDNNKDNSNYGAIQLLYCVQKFVLIERIHFLESRYPKASLQCTSRLLLVYYRPYVES
jgi:hypothetical protein